MTDICSIWAYHDIVESGFVGERQAQYLSVFVEENRPLTSDEAAELIKKKFGIGISGSGRGSRLSELEEKGFIIKIDKVKSPHTNHQVNRWKWTGRKQPFEKKLVNIKCPYCQGKGIVQELCFFDPDNPRKIIRRKSIKNRKIVAVKEKSQKTLI